jgi:hypothetical protein
MGRVLAGCDRRSKIRQEESCKLGCGYHLAWREVEVGGKVAAAVTIKNRGLHVRDGEHVPCHGPGSGAAAHKVQLLTDECKAFVRDQLLIGLSTETIIHCTFLFNVAPCI